MGAANSSSTVVGVPVNPRLEYANKRAKDEGEHMLLDAPSLVKLQPGTIRYRYLNDGMPVDQLRVEKPHESQNNLSKKGGYFYHTRLKDYSHSAEQEQESSWKFCYVYKGADRTRQKQVYYVFGKGLKTNEKGFVEPKYRSDIENLDEETAEKFYKYHGHIYYDVEYLPQDEELAENVDDILILGDEKAATEGNEVEVVVKDKEKISMLKRRLAIKMYKPAGHFHCYINGTELQNDDTTQLIKPKQEKCKRFKILLKPK